MAPRTHKLFFRFFATNQNFSLKTNCYSTLQFKITLIITHNTTLRPLKYSILLFFFRFWLKISKGFMSVCLFGPQGRSWPPDISMDPRDFWRCAQPVSWTLSHWSKRSAIEANAQPLKRTLSHWGECSAIEANAHSLKQTLSHWGKRSAIEAKAQPFQQTLSHFSKHSAIEANAQPLRQMLSHWGKRSAIEANAQSMRQTFSHWG